MHVIPLTKTKNTFTQIQNESIEQVCFGFKIYA